MIRGSLAPRTEVTARPAYCGTRRPPLPPWRVLIGEKVVARFDTLKDAMQLLDALNRVLREVQR